MHFFQGLRTLHKIDHFDFFCATLNYSSLFEEEQKCEGESEGVAHSVNTFESNVESQKIADMKRKHDVTIAQMKKEQRHRIEEVQGRMDKDLIKM